MLKRLIRALMVTALLGFGITLATAGPAQACSHGGDYCEINYKNTHNKVIVMCRDWTNFYGDGRNEKGTCEYTSDGGARRQLYNGQQTGNPNSSGGATFNWDDTDGFWVNSGYNVRIRTSNGQYYWYFATGWRKKGGCSDCLADIYHYAQ